MKRKSLILLIVAAILVLIQFIRPNYPKSETSEGKDIITVLHAPDNISNIVKSACYDCHSSQYEIPWYGKIAPTSWFVANHVNEGLEEFNMSAWTKYDRKGMDHKLEEAAEMMDEGEMPLKSYTIMHKEARLSKEQRKLLAGWFNSKRREISGNVTPAVSGQEEAHEHEHEHGHEHDHD